MEIIIYNGVTFRRRKDRNYFECGSTASKAIGTTLLHRYVWMIEVGEIPKGRHVHHLDHDAANNEVSNLETISASDHARLHYEERKEDLRRACINWAATEEGQRVRKDAIKKCISLN